MKGIYLQKKVPFIKLTLISRLINEETNHY